MMIDVSGNDFITFALDPVAEKLDTLISLNSVSDFSLDTVFSSSSDVFLFLILVLVVYIAFCKR